MTYLDDFGSLIKSIGFPDIYYMGLDDSSPNGIALNPYGGAELHNLVTMEHELIHSDVQVFVRNQDAQTGFSQLLEIYLKIREINNTVIGDTYFGRIRAHTPPRYIGRTTAGTYQYTCDFTLLFRDYGIY